MESIRVILEKDPVLAERLKMMAEGISYAKLAQLQDEKAKREKLRSLEYGEKQHLENPYWNGNLTSKMEFEKTADPVTLEFYKSEAMPVEINFGNLTHTMVLAKHNPVLRELWGRAAEINASWQADDYRQLTEAKAAAETALAAARARQGSNLVGT
jgi:hypothetical protein